MKSLPDQVKCLERELALRRRAYPKWVAQGKMRQETCDHEISSMEDCLETVKKVLTLAEIGEEMKQQKII